MPKITLKQVEFYYTDTEKGEETIIFSHGLLWSGYMFHKQVASLKERYRVITYDHRGQGQTQHPENGYDIDTLSEDAVALIEALCPNQQVHFAGLSMGGFVAMRIAARRPDLLKSVILMETSAESLWNCLPPMDLEVLLLPCSEESVEVSTPTLPNRAIVEPPSP